MTELIDTTEMYLRTVYELEEEGIPPLRARIAERLAQSGPTVSQTVSRMERDGLLVVADDRRIKLTDEGRQRATAVMRKHRLAEVMLVETLGLPWELVHEEACRWEHVISDRVEERLVALLGDPAVSPYGNPIPGAGGQAVPFERLDVLLEVGEPIVVVIERISEAAQNDPDLIALLADAGVKPGATLTAERLADRVRLNVDGGTPHTIEPEAAQLLFVRR